MSFINSMFSTEESVSVVFETLKITKDADNRKVETYTTNFTADCIVFQGAAADSMVSDRFKARVEAVILVDYDDYSAVKDKDRVKIGSDYYAVIHADNIANQNEVVRIPVEKYN